MIFSMPLPSQNEMLESFLNSCLEHLNNLNKPIFTPEDKRSIQYSLNKMFVDEVSDSDLHEALPKLKKSVVDGIFPTFLQILKYTKKNLSSNRENFDDDWELSFDDYTEQEHGNDIVYSSLIFSDKSESRVFLGEIKIKFNKSNGTILEQKEILIHLDKQNKALCAKFLNDYYEPLKKLNCIPIDKDFVRSVEHAYKKGEESNPLLFWFLNKFSNKYGDVIRKYRYEVGFAVVQATCKSDITACKPDITESNIEMQKIDSEAIQSSAPLDKKLEKIYLNPETLKRELNAAKKNLYSNIWQETKDRFKVTLSDAVDSITSLANRLFNTIKDSISKLQTTIPKNKSDIEQKNVTTCEIELPKKTTYQTLQQKAGFSTVDDSTQFSNRDDGTVESTTIRTETPPAELTTIRTETPPAYVSFGRSSFDGSEQLNKPDDRPVQTGLEAIRELFGWKTPSDSSGSRSSSYDSSLSG